jgi:hypothetical protein
MAKKCVAIGNILGNMGNILRTHNGDIFQTKKTKNPPLPPSPKPKRKKCTHMSACWLHENYGLTTVTPFST